MICKGIEYSASRRLLFTFLLFCSVILIFVVLFLLLFGYFISITIIIPSTQRTTNLK